MRVIDTESFIKKAIIIHGNKYDYSDSIYFKSKKLINIKCKIHGIFTQTASDHLKGYGCSKCSKKYKPTTEEWIQKAIEIHGNAYNYSLVNYKDNKTKVTIICPTHGKFEQIPNNHITKKTICPDCDSEITSNLYRKTTEQFIKDAIKIHKNLYDYSKVTYINKSKQINIICKIHGEFLQTPSLHLKGSGCSKCILKNQSKLFFKLKNSFIEEEILWEYSPKWLRKQIFDIYFPKYNIAIEYNGQQHYTPVLIFGGKIGLEKTIERDKTKRNKCIENNCNLFEIKYDYNDNDYENLLNNINNLINLKNNESKN